ncbi:phage tail protein [Escherichia coli]|nr:phage tail protein [Escherichia coli]
MAIKGLEQAVENLSRISKTAVPGASAMAINRVASTAINQSSSQVARETRVPETGKGKGQTETGHGQKSECQNYR